MDSGRHLDGSVVLHIGAPKTGTTFLQRLLWDNRHRLRDQGVLLPGDSRDAHFRAAVDLRSLPWGGREHPEYAGSWERLAEEARGWPGTTVISNELLAAATSDQIGRAVDSLAPKSVRCVYTVRPLHQMLASDWQEQVKHRHVVGWDDYLAQVLDQPGSQFGDWFWGLHDAAAVMSRWSRHVPPDRLRVVVSPPAGEHASVLWERFADAAGITPADYEPGDARANVGLSANATELLRRVNARLADQLPDEAYSRVVGEMVVGDALAAVAGPPAAVPENRMAQLRKRSAEIVQALADGGYPVVGSVDELAEPDAATPTTTAPTSTAASTERAAQSFDAGLELAAEVTATLVRRMDRLVTRADDLERQVDLAQAEVAVLSDLVGPSEPAKSWPKRTVARLSEEHRSVLAARRGWWWLANRLRSRR